MDEGERRRRRIRGSRGARETDTVEPAVPVAPGPPVAVEPEVTPSHQPAEPPHTRSPADVADFPDRSRVPEQPVRIDRSRQPVRSAGVPRPADPRGEHDRAAPEPDHYDAHAALAVPDDRDSERGLRGLVGGGSSQVGVGAAMRARDASRPTAADIAAAEAHLTIVHRGWVPRDV